jgi:hypothetical protein
MRKKTLVLLAVNLLLFFIIGRYLSEDHVQKAKAQDDKDLFNQAFADAHEIIVTRGKVDRERVLLVRTGNEWTLSEPLEWPANFFAARSILNGLQHIEAIPLFSAEELISEGESLGDYGLDLPSLTIEVTGPKGTIQLKFGDNTPDKTKVYALEPKSNRIFAVDQGLANDLAQPLQNLMKREFFDLQVNEVRSISVRFNQGGTTSKTTISRIDPEGDAWQISAPIETNANGPLIKGLLNQLLSGRVNRFIMDPVETESISEKLASPNLSVTLEGALRNQTIVAGELIDDGVHKGLRYARLEGFPTVFAIADELFQELRDAQRNMREKRFMHLNEQDIDSIEIAASPSKISLHRLEQKQWRVFARMDAQEIAQFPADEKIIENLLIHLSETDAESFVRDAPSETDLVSFGLLPAKLVVTLGSASGQDRVLLLGEPTKNKDGEVYAKSHEEPFVYSVSDSLIERLSLNPLHYRTRLLAPLAEGATIKNIILRDIEKNATLAELTLPERPLEELPLENETAIRTAELSGLIRRFMVQEYLSEPFKKEASAHENKPVPWRFQLSVEIALPGGDSNITQTRKYFFTDRLGGNTQIGGTPDCDSLFKLDQAMIDVLYELTRNSSPLPSPEQ